REVGDHHRGDDHDLIDPHQVHVAQPRVGVVGAAMLDVASLLAGERRLLQPAHDLLVHLGPGDADRVVAREVVGAAADGHTAAIQDGLAIVLPVRLADQLAVGGLDVLRPDRVGIVDVGVAIEDRERLCDALVSVAVVHGHPPSVTGLVPAPAARQGAPDRCSGLPSPWSPHHAAAIGESLAMSQGPGPLAAVHRITIITASLGALAYLAWEINDVLTTGT